MKPLTYRIIFALMVLSLASLSCQLVERAISREQPFGDGIQAPTEPAGAQGEDARPMPGGMLKADSQPLPNGLVLASPEETMAIIEEKKQVPYTADAPERYSAEEHNTVGKTLNFTILAASEDAVFPWFSAWCATTPEILAQNLKEIEYQLSVNGQPVDMDTVLQTDYTTGGQSCHGYSLAIYGWPAGKTTITETIVFKSSLNDGALDFPAGEMKRIYEITLERSQS